MRDCWILDKFFSWLKKKSCIHSISFSAFFIVCAGFLQFVKYTELTKDVGQHAVRENVCTSAFVANTNSN